LSLPAVVDKPVDIFYLYPTAWSKVNQTDPNFCAIDKPSMLIDTYSPGPPAHKDIFHGSGYLFYYFNLRENAANRAKIFRKQTWRLGYRAR
jgi:hypothetical protein